MRKFEREPSVRVALSSLSNVTLAGSIMEEVRCGSVSLPSTGEGTMLEKPVSCSVNCCVPSRSSTVSTLMGMRMTACVPPWKLSMKVTPQLL